MRKEIFALTLIILVLVCSTPAISSPEIVQQIEDEISEPDIFNPSIPAADSAQSITSWSETIASDTGLDPDSDTNADAVYSEWDFSETIDPDTMLVPDFDEDMETNYYIESRGIGSPWHTGPTIAWYPLTDGTEWSDTYTDDGIPCEYTYDGGAGGPQWIHAMSFTLELTSVFLSKYKLKTISAEVKWDDADLIDHEMWLRKWGGSSYSYVQVGATKYAQGSYESWTDEALDDNYLYPAPADTGQIEDSKMGFRFFEWRDNDMDDVVFSIDYLILEFELRDGYGYEESFADVSDWAKVMESSGLPSESFATDGDVGNLTITMDDASNEYVQYNTSLSGVSLTDFIEFRILCSTTLDDRKSMRINVYLDGTTVYSVHTAGEWVTYRALVGDIVSTVPTELKIHIDDYANAHDSGYGYGLFDYIRIGSVMGWGHDGSTTEGTTSSADCDVSSDGDKLNFASTNTIANMDIHFDTTTTDANGDDGYYSWIEWSITSLNDADSDGNVWALNIYDSGGTYSSSGYSDDTGIFRVNIKELTPTNIDFCRFYLQDSGEWAELDYIRLYGFNNWTYTDPNAGVASVTSVAYYDSGEDALVMQMDLTAGEDRFHIKSRNTNIGYSYTDMSLLFTIKATTNTTLKLKPLTYDSALRQGPEYALFDDWQTIAWHVGRDGDGILDYMQLEFNDWTDATDGGIESIYIKNNYTLRPSWYDASEESGTYAESFADVSDWNCPTAGGTDATTDGDVATFVSDSSYTWDAYHWNIPSMSLLGYYAEIRFRTNQSSSTAKFTIYTKSGDNYTGDALDTWAVMSGTPSTEWITKKFYIDDDLNTGITECITFLVKSYTEIAFEVDYLRIAPATEMGWQDDCSSLNAGYLHSKAIIDTDGDVIHFTGTDSSSSFYILYGLNIELTDYPFMEMRWKAPEGAEIQLLYHDWDLTQIPSGEFTETGDWQITRQNVKALITDGTIMTFMYVFDGKNGAQEFWVDYIKFYSIANFTVTQGGCETGDYIYVDNNVLYVSSLVSDGNEYVRLDYDPAVSVTTSTYNVLNVTTDCNDDALEFYFKEYVGGAWKTATDDTRRELVSGTMTDFWVQFNGKSGAASSRYISAIKFWEDSTDPTISDFWIVPASPTVEDEVTLVAFASDDVDGTYKCFFNAISYPTGFSDTNYDATESSEQEGLWNYTFSNLDAGYYAWEVNVWDGANNVTDLLVIQVTTVELSITDIVLITTGSTDIQVSGKTNMDAAYTIYENKGDGDVEQGSGNVNDGWFSISWTKESETGVDVGLAIKFTANSYTEWVNGSYSVASATVYDCHIVILNNLYELIPFDTFEVYKNDTRIYHDIIQVAEGSTYNITVKNRFGDTVNETIFDADHEMIVFVNTYSFKFMSWYNGFLRVNITRGGVTYSEIIMPMEIIKFRLYSENYDFSVDFLNGTTKHSFNIELTNSTGYIITGDTIADVFSLVNNVYDMVNQVNITVTTVQDNTMTIQLMFDWTNTTLYGQTINIISAFDWTNTTLYNQTISIAAAFNATNTVLYDQIILIQNMFDWDNTTLYSQTVSILAAFNWTNTTLYEQTVNILANISSVNSTIYGQTVSLLNYLYYSSTSIYNQTIDILSQLTLIDTNITANYISLSASLVAINSTILSNFTSITAQLLLMDSNLLSNFTEISATLLMIDSSLLSNFTYVMANLTAIGTNITTNYLSVSAMLSAIDSSLLSNFTSIAAALTLIDSNLLSNFTSITATLTAIGTNITTNYLAITAELTLIDSNMAANFTLIMAEIIATNSSIVAQTLLIIADIEFLNATMYLVYDPTHLNPLILGHSLSDDYCDFTIVSNWHNATLIIYDNDVPVAGPTSELLCPIRYTLSGTAGTHNLSVFVDGGNDSFWYNISYSIALDIRIEEWSVEDYIVEITGLSNADINWYIYNEGVYSGESGTESESIGFHFTFAKNTAIGKHNFSVYFNDTIDGAMYRWFNNSYTISAIYGISNIYTYNQGGDYIDWEQFTFLINGTQTYGNEFYNRTDYVYLITIQDVFGSNLYSEIHSWERTIKITIDVYTFIVSNMLDDQFIYFNMTRVAGGTWSQHIVPTGYIEFELLYAATYNYEYSTIATDGTVRTATGSVTIETDTAVIIFEFGLVKILAEIRLIAPGGGVGKKYVEEQFATVNATLSMMWTFLWGFGIFLITALWIVPFVGKRRRRKSSPSSKPSSGPSKPNKGIGGMVLPSATKMAEKEQKKRGMRQKDEREFVGRQ